MKPGSLHWKRLNDSQAVTSSEKADWLNFEVNNWRSSVPEEDSWIVTSFCRTPSSVWSDAWAWRQMFGQISCCRCRCPSDTSIVVLRRLSIADVSLYDRIPLSIHLLRVGLRKTIGGSRFWHIFQLTLRTSAENVSTPVGGLSERALSSWQR